MGKRERDRETEREIECNFKGKWSKKLWFYKKENGCIYGTQKKFRRVFKFVQGGG